MSLMRILGDPVRDVVRAWWTLALRPTPDDSAVVVRETNDRHFADAAGPSGQYPPLVSGAPDIARTHFASSTGIGRQIVHLVGELVIELGAGAAPRTIGCDG